MKNQLLLIHGANLNLLGKRNPFIYGNLTLQEIEDLTIIEAKKHGFNLITYQSNHEGNLIDKLQESATQCVGIIINPGAFAHYSYALHDALVDTKHPVIEVHLSAISQRESFRKNSVTASACIKIIEGQKEEGYKTAVNLLVEYLKNENHQ